MHRFKQSDRATHSREKMIQWREVRKGILVSIILHITHRDAWEAAASAAFYRPPTLDTEGFIHCSTIQQAADTANQFFHGRKDLVLLCIDEDKLDAKVKYESPTGGAAHDPRVGALFPHLYGPLNVSAVIRVVEFPPKADGSFVLPPVI
jgi:uncharacterized protein (DUF952 family)